MNSGSGRSNDSRIPAVDPLGGVTACVPRPRLAKAAHSSAWFSPPVFTWSACRIASRAESYLALAFCQIWSISTGSDLAVGAVGLCASEGKPGSWMKRD